MATISLKKNQYVDGLDMTLVKQHSGVSPATIPIKPSEIYNSVKETTQDSKQFVPDNSKSADEHVIENSDDQLQSGLVHKYTNCTVTNNFYTLANKDRAVIPSEQLNVEKINTSLNNLLISILDGVKSSEFKDLEESLAYINRVVSAEKVIAEARSKVANSEEK